MEFTPNKIETSGGGSWSGSSFELDRESGKYTLVLSKRLDITGNNWSSITFNGRCYNTSD